MVAIERDPDADARATGTAATPPPAPSPSAPSPPAPSPPTPPGPSGDVVIDLRARLPEPPPVPPATGPVTAPAPAVTSPVARPATAGVVLRCGLGTAVLGVAALAAVLAGNLLDGGAGLAASFGLLGAGLLAGGALWGWGVHAARHRVDEPVARLRGTVRAAGRGQLHVRSGLTGATDVAALGGDLDAVLALAEGRVAGLTQQAEWGAQVRMIFEALDLVDDEAAAHQVVREALGMLDPSRPMELLLAPPGSDELLPVAVNAGVDAPACPVTDLDGCVAVRRSQTVVFESSDSINSCPRLKGRPGGACSAVCVPVSVGGRAVGALHATGPDRHPPDQVTADKLATLSTQLGNRLGALRALETSRTEAATDPLTGLPNRRTLETRLEQLLERGVPFVLVVADLDKFKAINSGHGLETGDRALAAFAAVLRDKVRGNDLVARYGGEEFVLVYPEMAVGTSVEAIERIRDGLEEAIERSGIPWFTCSFGITHSDVGRTPEAVIRVANAGLERAKALGRDQVVYADAALADEVFGPER